MIPDPKASELSGRGRTVTANRDPGHIGEPHCQAVIVTVTITVPVTATVTVTMTVPA